MDLSGCWDEHELFEHREEIISLASKCSRFHEHCCRFLTAAASLQSDTYRIALEATSCAKTVKAATRIGLSEFKVKHGTAGKENIRFLSAITNKGFCMFDDTAKNLCDRIYLIDDVYGASSRLLLSTLRGQALANGYDIITCYCPLAPFEKIEHIFVPELRVGFMTANDYHQPDIEPYKVIHSRRFTDQEQLKSKRKRISFNKKAARQMLQQAAKLLADAKDCHDKLEEYYISAMDFDKVNAVCENTLKKYRHIVSRYEEK
ncbi:hypothetical protein [Youxingia wuxianensis]|uniref:Uncharacterized protein n=1 Tax=Youxingia wuxianensis TaxID=2763678 RepID=A0A926EUJ0_9FIRM|nr:hypothetical protein [Youxingia wuxianensis]MBC8586510.1 hypothetical protein [Youxingia wuxianensis]